MVIRPRLTAIRERKSPIRGTLTLFRERLTVIRERLSVESGPADREIYATDGDSWHAVPVS